MGGQVAKTFVDLMNRGAESSPRELNGILDRSGLRN